MLAENSVLKQLKQEFIVAMDPYYPRNATPFGVWTWVFAPDGTEVEKYWYGTGNDIISLSPSTGEERRIEIHEIQTEGVARMLAASVKRARWMREGKHDEIRKAVLSDARLEEKDARGVGLGRVGRWWAYGTPLQEQLDATVELGAGGALWVEGIVAACRSAKVPVRSEVTSKPERRPMRYPESMRKARLTTWLERASRSGLHWYVDGETIVITDDPRKAFDHYEEALRATRSAGR